MVQIQNNFTELFLLLPSTEMAQMNKRGASAPDKKYL